MVVITLFFKEIKIRTFERSFKSWDGGGVEGLGQQSSHDCFCCVHGSTRSEDSLSTPVPAPALCTINIGAFSQFSSQNLKIRRCAGLRVSSLWLFSTSGRKFALLVNISLREPPPFRQWCLKASTSEDSAVAFVQYGCIAQHARVRTRHPR